MKNNYYFIITILLLFNNAFGKKNQEEKAFDILYAIDTTMYSLIDSEIDTISFEIQLSSLDKKIEEMKGSYYPALLNKIHLDSFKIICSIGQTFGRTIEYKNLHLSGDIDFDYNLLEILKKYINMIQILINQYLMFFKSGIMHSGINEIQLVDGINEYVIEFVRYGYVDATYSIKSSKSLVIEKLEQSARIGNSIYFPEFEKVGKKYLLKTLKIKSGEFETIYEMSYIEKENLRLPNNALINSKSYNANTSEILRFSNHRIIRKKSDKK